MTDTGEFEARKGTKRKPILSGGELELIEVLKTAQPSMPLKKVRDRVFEFSDVPLLGPPHSTFDSRIHAVFWQNSRGHAC